MGPANLRLGDEVTHPINTSVGKYTLADPVYAWSQPALSEWECWLFGGDANSIVYRPLEGNEPNWFWRLMQYLCFGCRWRKVPK